MLSKFFGKGQNADNAHQQEAQDTRGLEVTEDDPDTAWSMWDNALAEQDSRFGAAAAATKVPLPPITGSATHDGQDGLEVDLDIPTQPLALQERTLEQRKNDALDVVELHHRRIANTIRTLWGYKECSAYVNKLILAGGDGMGQNRVGFNQEAVEAMLELVDVHDAIYGSFDTGGGIGFGDSSVHPGLDGSRF